MKDIDVAYFIDEMDSRISLLLDKVQNKYSLEKYSSASEIMEYFGIDKPNFLRLTKEGMPVLLIGKRWKGKLKDIEDWFKMRNNIVTTN